MELTARINIKKVIEKNPELAKELERDSKTLDTAIPKFAELAKVSEIFIKQNLGVIRNWLPS